MPISAFSKQDPDTLFRIIATSSNQANMRGAASLIIPPRTSLLNDAELRQANRFYPAALASYDTGLPAPALPEFYAVGEFITRRILQAVTGEMPVKQALDAAATETTDFLKGHGYYK
jgi:multiple sugar transport system substrate-binding protein